MKEKMSQISKQSMIIISVSMFILGCFFYALILVIIKNFTSPSGFIFTNPALNYTELEESITSNKTLNISKQINTYIRNKKSAGDITHLSVYFRNLNNGGWFGLNEKEYFSPASLMKLPILISYLKKAESQKGFLDTKIVYKKNPKIKDFKQNVPPEYQLIDGQEYSLRDVLQYLIIYSDNNASALLESYLPMADLQRTFTDIGLTFPSITSGSFDNNVKVIDYASFFRVLFNASYLNRKDSEKALALLTKVEFKGGLVSGVPQNIPVSHKFGERGIVGFNGNEEKQLHDCGIVYYPSHPYIICVMTRGDDWNNLKTVIGDISNIVYKQTQKQYGNNPDSE